jgi:hypothetical protein
MIMPTFPLDPTDHAGKRFAREHLAVSFARSLLRARI